MTLRADTEATSQKGVPIGLVRNSAVFLSDMLNLKFLIGATEGERLALGFALLTLIYKTLNAYSVTVRWIKPANSHYVPVQFSNYSLILVWKKGLFLYRLKVNTEGHFIH